MIAVLHSFPNGMSKKGFPEQGIPFHFFFTYLYNCGVLHTAWCWRPVGLLSNQREFMTVDGCFLILKILNCTEARALWFCFCIEFNCKIQQYFYERTTCMNYFHICLPKKKKNYIHIYSDSLSLTNNFDFIRSALVYVICCAFTGHLLLGSRFSTWNPRNRSVLKLLTHRSLVYKPHKTI